MGGRRTRGWWCRGRGRKGWHGPCSRPPWLGLPPSWRRPIEDRRWGGCDGGGSDRRGSTCHHPCWLFLRPWLAPPCSWRTPPTPVLCSSNDAWSLLFSLFSPCLILPLHWRTRKRRTYLKWWRERYTIDVVLILLHASVL